LPKLVRELDDACAPLLDKVRELGGRAWVVSEYGHCNVCRPVYLNRILREAGLVAARLGPFGEQLDVFNCRALAVCDHQLAQIYVSNPADLPRVRELLAGTAGIARVLQGDERDEVGLRHPRSGELVVLAARDAWFAYPFWLDDRLAPDYARTVAIHHKPGYDPCELFLDPALPLAKLRVAIRLIQKKLGFRMKLDVIPLDARLVRGSHGLNAAEVQDRPILIGDGPPPGDNLAMTDVRDLLLRALGYEPTQENAP
jgi:hypothetical protein